MRLRLPIGQNPDKIRMLPMLVVHVRTRCHRLAPRRLWDTRIRGGLHCRSFLNADGQPSLWLVTHVCPSHGGCSGCLLRILGPGESEASVTFRYTFGRSSIDTSLKSPYWPACEYPDFRRV